MHVAGVHDLDFSDAIQNHCRIRHFWVSPGANFGQIYFQDLWAFAIARLEFLYFLVAHRVLA